MLGPGVAGTTVPAFVERNKKYLNQVGRSRVSPGLRSRPSLSGRLRALRDRSLVELPSRVSPGLRSRPSLSDQFDAAARRRPRRGVAGTTVPAFVERVSHRGCSSRSESSVAGTTVPAFVERSSVSFTDIPAFRGVAGTTVPAFVERGAPLVHDDWESVGVSPGLRSRPSLSVAVVVAGQVVPALCRRDYGPGLR